MPKVIKRRIDKKSEAAGDLGETVTDIRNKIKERQKSLVYAFLAAGLILITVGGVVVYNRAGAGKAQQLEYEGYQLLAAAPSQNVPPADRLKSVLQKFNASYAAKKNPSVLLNIANCNYELGNFDEAIKSLKKVIDEYPEPKISSLAYYKLALTYIGKGDLNSALKTFDALISVKDAFMQDMALIESGKTLEAMGKPEEAKNKYKDLINKFPKSPLMNEAKARLGSQ
ncbi:MAG: tetratricopeptide repeat protein [Nitrospirae bacterium]|nr:tetratricopeptide repeat protein [Nitrospirota bacterium]